MGSGPGRSLNGRHPLVGAFNLDACGLGWRYQAGQSQVGPHEVVVDVEVVQDVRVLALETADGILPEA